MSSCKADKFASEEEIIGSANYRVIGTHPLQLCLVAKGSTNNYSIVLHMYNPSAGSCACSHCSCQEGIKNFDWISKMQG